MRSLDRGARAAAVARAVSDHPRPVLAAVDAARAALRALRRHRAQRHHHRGRRDQADRLRSAGCDRSTERRRRRHATAHGARARAPAITRRPRGHVRDRGADVLGAVGGARLSRAHDSRVADRVAEPAAHADRARSRRPARARSLGDVAAQPADRRPATAAGGARASFVRDRRLLVRRRQRERARSNRDAAPDRPRSGVDVVSRDARARGRRTRRHAVRRGREGQRPFARARSVRAGGAAVRQPGDPRRRLGREQHAVRRARSRPYAARCFKRPASSRRYPPPSAAACGTTTAMRWRKRWPARR